MGLPEHGFQKALPPDNDQPYVFGRQFTTDNHPFNTREYVRLLILRSQIQNKLTGADDTVGTQQLSQSGSIDEQKSNTTSQKQEDPSYIELPPQNMGLHMGRTYPIPGPRKYDGSWDGVGAADENQPYYFGRQFTTDIHLGLSLKEYTNLLTLKGKLIDKSIGLGDGLLPHPSAKFSRRQPREAGPTILSFHTNSQGQISIFEYNQPVRGRYERTDI